MRPTGPGFAVLSSLLLAACHPDGVDLHDAVHSTKAEAAATPHAPPEAQAGGHSGGATIDIQGGRMDCTHPMISGFHALSREEFAEGPEKVDLAAYKQKTFAFMRETILKAGGTEEDAKGWIDHVEDIPRQMIEIVKDEPDVLASCETFNLALSGPP